MDMTDPTPYTDDDGERLAEWVHFPGLTNVSDDREMARKLLAAGVTLPPEPDTPPELQERWFTHNGHYVVDRQNPTVARIGCNTGVNFALNDRQPDPELATLIWAVTAYRDWVRQYAAARGEPVTDWERFAVAGTVAPDGVHLTTAGRVAYAKAITQAMGACDR